MMKILLIAATTNVVKELTDQLEYDGKLNNNLTSYRFELLEIDLLITGHGSVFTTYHLMKTLQIFRYDLAINLGVAGSFDYFLELGSVVNVVQDQFADLGFETGNNFYTLHEKEMFEENVYPFTGEILQSVGTFNLETVDSMFPVKAITMNTLHERMERIQLERDKFNCDIETMDGAAFFYVCLMEKIPFLQIRAVSYFVELRKVENWNIPKATKNLNQAVFDILVQLSKEV